MRFLNICIFNESFGMGGLERVSSVIGKGLINHNVLYYSMFDDKNYYEIDNEIITLNANIKVNKYLNHKNYIRKVLQGISVDFSPAWYHRDRIKKFINWVEINEIDAVIASGPFLIAMIPYLEKYTNARYIAWIHNNFQTYMNKYTKGYKKYFINGLKEADEVVVLTNEDLNNYRQFNENINLIYNPLTITNTQKSTLLNKNISFTARIAYEHKGIDYLIQVAKRLPNDWTISVAGQGNEEEKLREEIRENNIEDKLILLGALNDKGLRKHYLNSSIYLMTSRWEGFGLVLVEAMDFGLPIIAFSQTGSDEVLANGKYGVLVENGNVSELTNQLTLLINDVEKRKQYQKLSLERVEDFQLKNIITKWNEVLLKIER
ncbi:hypothetical protein B9P78_04255 [Aerococcus sp. 1KP-2016]|nr:hypothetical protein B9P78_04255 [Aerococcus sp. 1KP-2016]